jgi:hypothetical protein
VLNSEEQLKNKREVNKLTALLLRVEPKRTKEESMKKGKRKLELNRGNGGKLQKQPSTTRQFFATAC